MRVESAGMLNKGGWMAWTAMIAMACLVCVDAMAQRGGGIQISQEKLDEIWRAQADGIGREIKLDKEKIAKVVAAYKASREAQAKEVQELFAGGQRGPGMFQEMREINETESGILKDNLMKFLSEKDSDTAVASLGSYNRQWDRLVSTILGFELEDAKQKKALELIAGYVVESNKARDEAIASGDFQSIRTASEELKGMLDMSIASLLSKEQVETWKTATERRRRGGGGGFGGGGGRRN